MSELIRPETIARQPQPPLPTNPVNVVNIAVAREQRHRQRIEAAYEAILKSVEHLCPPRRR